MTDHTGGTGKTVRCRCGDTAVIATYDVEGRFLVLTTPFGIKRTVLGLQHPQKLARRFLKKLCVPACAKACAPNISTTVNIPDAAVIDAMRPGKGRMKRGPRATAARRLA